MANKDLLAKMKSERYETLEEDGITFKLKKVDEVTLQNINAKIKKNRDAGNQFEAEMILTSIVSVKGLKYKHLTDDPSQYDVSELVKEVEYESATEMREILEIYLGLNHEVFRKLYEIVGTTLIKILETREIQKKALPTELNT